jgi:hypothetical protein
MKRLRPAGEEDVNSKRIRRAFNLGSELIIRTESAGAIAQTPDLLVSLLLSK